jgi:hypothetical protein
MPGKSGPAGSGQEGSGAGSGGEGFATEQKTEGPQAKHCYIYEFNEELVICTRRLSDGTGHSEPSLPLTVPDLSDDTDIVQAEWMTDPLIHEVPGLTIKRLKLLVNRGGSSYCGELWASTHAVTKHKISIQQRVDRNLLLSLFEQTRQILQIRIDLFGPIEDQRSQLPKDSDFVKKSLSFMQPIAEKYCRGDLCKDDLKNARDVAIKELGLVSIKKAAMKRPACCEAVDSALKTEPVTKPCAKKKPVKKEPVSEPGAKEEPGAKKEPVKKKPCAKKDSVTKDSVTQEPVTKGLVKKKPCAKKDSVTKDSVTQEPVTKELVQEKPVKNELVDEASSATAPVYEEMSEPPFNVFFASWLTGV